MSLLHLDCKDATPVMSFTQRPNCHEHRNEVVRFLPKQNIDLCSKYHTENNVNGKWKTLLAKDLFPIFAQIYALTGKFRCKRVDFFFTIQWSNHAFNSWAFLQPWFTLNRRDLWTQHHFDEHKTVYFFPNYFWRSRSYYHIEINNLPYVTNMHGIGHKSLMCVCGVRIYAYTNK